MRYIALKELPQGQQPGDEFETTEEQGDVLVMVGSAKRVVVVEKDEPRPSRRYQRRDLQAET